MKPLIVLPVLILLPVIWTKVEGANNCNDACQTKSYSISRDGLIGCSGADNNCLMEGNFKASLINGQTVLNINIVGYDFALLNEGTFSLVLLMGNTKDSKYSSKYSCSTSIYGASSGQVTVDGVSYVNGSTKIDQKNLYCSWYMVYESDIWPKFGGDKSTFQSDRNLQLLFEVDSKLFAISSTIVDLPIYRMQFLQCCYKIHGNEVYKLIVDQNEKQTNFFLQSLDSTPYILSASLSDRNGKQLIFDCYISSVTGYVKGYLKTEAFTDDISLQLFSTSFIRYTQCSWSLPLTVQGSFSNYETKDGVYDLQILADSQVVFDQSNVPLRSFNLKIVSSLWLIISTHLIVHLLIN